MAYKFQYIPRNTYDGPEKGPMRDDTPELAYVKKIEPGTPEWEESEKALEKQRLDEAYDAWCEELNRHDRCRLGNCHLGSKKEDCPIQFQAECYFCGNVSKWVVKEGPVINPADPTQTYVLECGHTVI